MSTHCKLRCVQRYDFTRYAYEAFILRFLFLFLLLFLMLPHSVHGITNGDPKQRFAGFDFIHSDPHFIANRSVIVELFEWKYVDVSAECSNFLGPKGYAGVQLSPVTEHLLLLDGDHAQSWLVPYQPVSLKFATRFGSVEDFLAMSHACNAAGVRIYVDVVLNHMAGNTSSDDGDGALLLGTAGSTVNISSLDYSGVPFDASDFHEPCMLENYFDSYAVRVCQVNGQPDLNLSKPSVQERVVALLNQLIEFGVAGFRIDAAKYIWPNDLKDIFKAVNNLNSENFYFEKNSRPLFYQEVVDLGMDSVSKTEYSGIGIVTEYLYAAELSTIFSGKVPLSSLINWGPAMGFVPHQDALVFVDSHESEHNHLERELGKHQLLSYKQQRQYVMATALMLAHPYGRIKRILSSYHFPANDKQRGPPSAPAATPLVTATAMEPTATETAATATAMPTKMTEEDNSASIRSPEFDIRGQCTPASGWVCEHRWPAIVNMLALMNDLSAVEDGVRDFQTYGPNHIAFCRGQKAFIAFNNDVALDYATTVHTCMEPGVYCDVISGGLRVDGNDCNGKRIVVKENGMADLLLPALATTQANGIDIESDGNGGGGGEGEGDNGGTDIETEGYIDEYDVAEWEGIPVDVDYGLIAIYIGSKLVSRRGEAEELNKPMATDLKAQVMETERDA